MSAANADSGFGLELDIVDNWGFKITENKGYGTQVEVGDIVIGISNSNSALSLDDAGGKQCRCDPDDGRAQQRAVVDFWLHSNRRRLQGQFRRRSAETSLFKFV